MLDQDEQNAETQKELDELEELEEMEEDVEYDANDIDLGELGDLGNLDEAELERELERERKLVEEEENGLGGGDAMQVEDLEDIMGGMSSKLKNQGLGVNGKRGKKDAKGGKKRKVEIEYEDEDVGRRQKALA